MRHFALILGFLLVLSSLHPGHRQSGGAVVSDLQPVGVLPVGAESLGRGDPRSEPEPSSSADDLLCHDCFSALASQTPHPCHGTSAFSQPEPARVLTGHPARAPPRLT